MNKLLSIITVISTTFIASCETVKESTILGSSIGAIIGAAAGASSSPNNNSKRALTGSAAGAAIGGLAGYLHKLEDKKLKPQISAGDGMPDIPSLTMPQIRRVWVPDQIQGKKLIKGHFIYVIEKQGRWKVENKN